LYSRQVLTPPSVLYAPNIADTSLTFLESNSFPVSGEPSRPT
jgi:hypothetical protein